MDACSRSQSQPLLRVRNLSVVFKQPHLTFLALQKVSFDLQSGKTLALVGESGSGKTMIALALLGLLSGKLASAPLQHPARTAQRGRCLDPDRAKATPNQPPMGLPTRSHRHKSHRHWRPQTEAHYEKLREPR
ncbi:ATP-binding cassette domain-containing protein, partial [candidate division KSB1 bacterium]|nr:ATP-binding cassette domain-containing protein [candidate division KSB1 bacterium]